MAPLAALTTAAAQLWIVLAPPDAESGSSGGEINWLLDAPWAKVALLVTLAVAVMFLANQRMRRRRGRGSISPPNFDLRIARLERLPVTTISEARTGDAHIGGVLAKGQGALGTGPRACVYQNRAKSSRATAIAAELVMLEDETGRIGIEGLEAARVIAPKEEKGAHDTIGLYLGDRVEVLGEVVIFESPQTADGRPLHGMIGSLGQIQIRVVERPGDEAAEADTRSATDDAPSDESPADAEPPPAAAAPAPEPTPTNEAP